MSRTPPKGLNEDQLHAWFDENARYHEQSPGSGKYSVTDPRTPSKSLFSDDTRELWTRFDSLYGGRTHLYLANCTQFPDRGPELGNLNELVENAIDVSLPTLKRYCVQLEYWAELMGYGNTPKDLKLADDYHVKYQRGKFDGQRAYFIVHSGIEHIWLPEDYVSKVRRRHRLRFTLPIGDVRACRTAIECQPKFGGLKVFRPEE